MWNFAGAEMLQIPGGGSFLDGLIGKVFVQDAVQSQELSHEISMAPPAKTEVDNFQALRVIAGTRRVTFQFSDHRCKAAFRKFRGLPRKAERQA